MKKIFKFLFLFLVIVSSRHAYAGKLFIDLDSNQVKTGGLINAQVFLDTEGQSINTIEGDIEYDPKLLKVEKINTGGSFVSFWVENPDTQKKVGDIHFSGITPGGITTNKNQAFSIILRAENVGDASLSLKNTALLLINDGEGTPAKTTTADANIKIAPSIGGEPENIVSKDTVSPEKFTITRSRDGLIFDNKWFLAFDTKDKDSGVVDYKVCEYFSCSISNSPHMLQYQNPFYFIRVFAYDGNGNSREARLISPYWILILSIIVLISVLAYLYRRYSHSNKV